MPYNHRNRAGSSTDEHRCTPLIVGSIIFRYPFVGFVAGSFQAIRTDFVKEVQLIEIHQEADLLKANIINRTKSQTTIHEESEQVVWPRDTLFRYYELMEQLQCNLEEKII
ncbi:hypothetical protein AOLI_G00256570 [Acnodon oligacanthus]